MPLPPFPASRTLRSAALPLAAALALGACGGDARPPATSPPPPAAEFILSAGDSAFWVTSRAGTLRLRGAPISLARVGGRFYELYVVDDDRSFEDAILIGQRVYRRDIVSGDSLLVFQDTLVPRIARLYAREHPDDRPLRDDDEGSAEPLWTATSTVDLGRVFGRFVSYAIHADVQRERAPLWHTTSRGVLDLVSGRPATLASVAGPAEQNVARARSEAVRALLDSIRGSAPDIPILSLGLDPASFSLTTSRGEPAIAYALTGAGEGDAGHLLALPPIAIGEPAWWAETAASLPVSSANGGRDVWHGASYEVVVRYDSAGRTAHLSLRDSTSREWLVGTVSSPASRIFWLDSPAVDSLTRAALARAFNESSLYDETVRTAAHHPTAHAARTRALLVRHLLRRPHLARPPRAHSRPPRA